MTMDLIMFFDNQTVVNEVVFLSMFKQRIIAGVVY